MEINVIARKLRLDAKQQILILNAPAEYTAIVKGFIYDIKPDAKKAGTYDFVQVFAISQKEMEILIKQVAAAGSFDCLFWACYPKKTGAIKSDLYRDSVWRALAIAHLRPVTAISLNDTWSALRGRPPEMVK